MGALLSVRLIFRIVTLAVVHRRAAYVFALLMESVTHFVGFPEFLIYLERETGIEPATFSLGS